MEGGPARDMECGPIDRSLLFMQEDHISTTIWAGGDRPKLDVRQYTARMGEWKLVDAVQHHLLDSWGFGVFVDPTVVPQNDIALISALVERWRPETNSFHFPFGELTITLEDVYMIMGLPISGRAVTHTELQHPQSFWVNNWEDIRLKKKDRKDMWSSRGSAVSLQKIRNRYGNMPNSKNPKYIEQDVRVYTRAYLFYIIGAILFPTSSRDVVHPRYLQLLQNTDEIGDYAWGAAVLAYLYRGLGKAAKKTSTSINGCTMLLQLWAYERLMPGRPQIAPYVQRYWPRAVAWAEPVKFMRINPHHHVGQYRGDFDSFDLQWLTWEPYAHFYQLDDIDQDDDADLHLACHMALGRIPLIAFEIVEYQMPDRVLRQFGILQHIPEDPFDMSHLRTEKVSPFQRDDHTSSMRRYLDEWDSYVATGMPIVGQGSYVPISEYMHWFMRYSKLRIAPFVAPDPERIHPRDWYPQQDMANALESAMRMAHAIHLRGGVDWVYEFHLPNFLSHYDRVMTEWKGLAFDRPVFVRPKPPSVVEQPPPVVEHPTVSQAPTPIEVNPTAPTSFLDTPFVVSQKRPRDDVDIEVETRGPHTIVQASHKRPRDDASIETPPSASPLITQIRASAPDPDPETSAPTSPPITQIEALTSNPDPETSAPTSPPITQVLEIEASTSYHTPIHAHVIVQDTTTGFDSSEHVSLPTDLRDKFDMDSYTDKFLDGQRRGGQARSGDMTRPLKNRKIRWLYRNWWGKESEFEWREHGGRISYILNWSQIQTLQPERWIQDDVLNAYLELVKVRDFDMFGNSPLAKKYFFGPSYFFTRAMHHCGDLGLHPDSKTEEQLLEQYDFYRQFRQQFIGPDLVNCDYAFFPACTNIHWILFIVDVQRGKVSLVDPLNDDKDYPLRKVYAEQFYIMVMHSSLSSIDMCHKLEYC